MMKLLRQKLKRLFNRDKKERVAKWQHALLLWEAYFREFYRESGE